MNFTVPGSIGKSARAKLELRKTGEAVCGCLKCPLSMTRNRAVPGEGSPNAQVVFIGEGPGRREDIEGRPFVGRAGKLLDALLASIKLSRESVYITNIVKCRPTTGVLGDARDRKPTGKEIDACVPHLERELQAIRPRIVCPLGGTATRFILEKYGLRPGNISKMHGRTHSTGGIKIVPMYHPAAALYAARLKATLEKDFGKLAGLLQ